jgi:hypothetical protein
MNGSLNAFLQRYGLTALIVGSIVAIAVVMGWETGWGRYLTPGTPPIAAGNRKAEEIALLPAFNLPPISPAFKETAERPLFNQSRRPVPAAAVVAAAPTMQKGKYRLVGAVVAGDVSTAFLVEIQSNKTFRVTKGGVVNPNDSQGPMLDSVSPTEAVLKLGTDSETLTLATAKSPAASTVAVAPGIPNSGVPGVQGQPGVAPQAAFGGQALQPFSPPPGSPTTGLPAPIMPIPGTGGGPVPLPPNTPGIAPLPPGAYPLPGTVQPIQGAAQTTPATVEPTTLRRRRFQNLPQ